MPLDAIRNATARPGLPRPRRPRTLLVAALLLGAAAPLAAQPQNLLVQDAPGEGPKSLLPEGLEAAPPPVVRPLQPRPEPAPEADATAPATDATASNDADQLEEANPLAELNGPAVQPEAAGLLTEANGGYGADLFATTSGPFAAALLRRIDAPLASRWAQIVLQRALLSRATPPADIDTADWLAARATALLALGAGSDAHRLVSGIALKHYTPALYQAAFLAAMATADPVALCPLSPTARDTLRTATWQLVDAMCLSILGDDLSATAVFDDLRRRQTLNAFDIGLAERVASTVSGGRRGANPEWGEAERLTPWRLGLATAAGLDIPARMWEGADARLQGWAVRLANLPLATRAEFAAPAAATGAFSSAELDRLLADATQATPAATQDTTAGGRIRTANVAPDARARLAAMRELWKQGAAATPDHYGWQIAAAAAAARLQPEAALANDAAAIAASLNAAGLPEFAARWWSVADAADRDARAALWAQLVGISASVPVDGSLFSRWADSVPAHRRDLLAAGLEGLGRDNPGAKIPPLDNDWTRALQRAVDGGRAGEIIILSAIGLKGSWAEVPPDYLRRIVAALRGIGRGAEAQLLVAEAANRG